MREAWRSSVTLRQRRRLLAAFAADAADEQARQESTDSTSFHTRLADAMERGFLNGHPSPDSPIEYIGPNGKIQKTPRQVVKEIRSQTPFGEDRTAFYMGVSLGQGDPTGQKVIDEFSNWWKKA